MRGVSSGRDVAALLGALIADVMTDRVTPEKAAVVCNAVGKILRLVEMEYRWGTKEDPDGRRTIRLDVTGQRKKGRGR